MNFSSGLDLSFHRFTRKTASSSLLAACLFFGSATHADIIFNFNFSGAFTDGTNDAAQQGALITAGNLFSTMFGSHFTNSATLVFDASGSDDPLSSTLASAGSNSIISAGFGTGEIIRTKLISNGATDLNGAAADGIVDVNFGADWELDPNTPAQGSASANPTFDFYAAVFHEFTHALGFLSYITEAGDDGDGNGNNGNPGTWSFFDQFMTDCGPNSLIDSGNLQTNQGVYDAAKTSAMCFNGVNANAANGGNQIDLYTPNPYENGSSGSHLNTNNPIHSLSMMKHDRDFGPQEARNYNAIEIAMLTDLGYTRVTNSVPEPGTLALFIGAGIGGLLTRRRRT